MRYLGAFVSVAGGLVNGVENGNFLGVNSIMMHPSPPQRWCTKPFAEDQIKAFNEARNKSKIEKILLHGIYLINLANPDKQKFHLSKLALVYYLDLCEKINADGVVFHVGSFKDIGEEEGFERVIYGVNWVLKEVNNSAKLLLECAAGAGNVVGDTLEDLKRIRAGVDQKEKVGFCLDTQHMFASGYDIKNTPEKVLDEVDKQLGIENIGGVHFNDSKTEFNSKRDRHENLGMGLIGEDGMKKFLNDPRLANVPFIMEVPDMKSLDTAKPQVDILHRWAK